MIVIADTSPLNYLIQLGLIEELRTIYGRVVLPATVRKELEHLRSPDSVPGMVILLTGLG
jgi:predicted nucleic acid-binding protein